jgi:lipoic acid synthetase
MIRARWLGRVPYREAWDLQRALARRADDDYLLLLEHPPVVTLGAHADPSHVRSDLADAGIDRVEVDRGGDVTVHVPGQLVGYPIVSVGTGPHQGAAHVHRVEQVVLDALVTLGVPAERVGRLEGYPGIWFDAATPGAVPRKVCAVGVRVSRGRTTHGFALNVDPDLSVFDHVVPCGIADLGVTSLASEGFGRPRSEVVDALVRAAGVHWGGVTDDARVTTGPTAGAEPARPPRADGDRGARSGQPVAVRRLRHAGVDPDATLPVATRKPDWLRAPATMRDGFLGLRRSLRELALVTVCEEAGCPNISECWSDGTATFMINGDRCTRACGFCKVDTRRPLPLDPGEPERVAEAVARMGLTHAVVTCVARDDLADGGAGAFAATVTAVRRRSPGTRVEVLVSDFRGDPDALALVVKARPDVFNHNLETVARLQQAARPQAGYARSLTVLARAADAGLSTKSGLMVGLGETEGEVLAALGDLRAVGVEIVTIGQYLRPSSHHLPVARWWTPAELDRLAQAGASLGFAHVQATPLTRSSYHARQAADAATGAVVPA